MWVTHPEHPADAGHATTLADLTGANRPDEHLAHLDPAVVTITLDTGRATLSVHGRPITTIDDGDWCDVAGLRGWALLAVTPNTPPRRDSGPVDYLHGGAHVGIVTTQWADAT